MKGQIFITVSILVAVTLLVLTINNYSVQEKDQYLYNYFTNLKTEMTNTVDNAILDSKDVSKSIEEFSSFSNKVLFSKGYVQTIKYNVFGNSAVIDIYLGKGDEYYRDTLVIDRTVST